MSSKNATASTAAVVAAQGAHVPVSQWQYDADNPNDGYALRWPQGYTASTSVRQTLEHVCATLALIQNMPGAQGGYVALCLADGADCGHFVLLYAEPDSRATGRAAVRVEGIAFAVAAPLRLTELSAFAQPPRRDASRAELALRKVAAGWQSAAQASPGIQPFGNPAFYNAATNAMHGVAPPTFLTCADGASALTGLGWLLALTPARMRMSLRFATWSMQAGPSSAFAPTVTIAPADTADARSASWSQRPPAPDWLAAYQNTFAVFANAGDWSAGHRLAQLLTKDGDGTPTSQWLLVMAKAVLRKEVGQKTSELERARAILAAWNTDGIVGADPTGDPEGKLALAALQALGPSASRALLRSARAATEGLLTRALRPAAVSEVAACFAESAQRSLLGDSAVAAAHTVILTAARGDQPEPAPTGVSPVARIRTAAAGVPVAIWLVVAAQAVAIGLLAWRGSPKPPPQSANPAGDGAPAPAVLLDAQGDAAGDGESVADNAQPRPDDVVVGTDSTAQVAEQATPSAAPGSGPDENAQRLADLGGIEAIGKRFQSAVGDRKQDGKPDSWVQPMQTAFQTNRSCMENPNRLEADCTGVWNALCLQRCESVITAVAGMPTKPGKKPSAAQQARERKVRACADKCTTVLRDNGIKIWALIRVYSTCREDSASQACGSALKDVQGIDE